MRAAIVGCGSIAQVHAQVLRTLPDLDLIACADILPRRAEKMAAEFGGRAYDNLAALLAKECPDVLHICTPHHLHTEMARAARQRGMAVFCEKPPAISHGQWAEFSALDGPVGICFQNRYNPAVQYVREQLKTAGEILGARAFVTWSRDKAYYTESGWRGALETEGGGVLINQAVHTLDLLVSFMGKPLDCTASCHNRHLKGIISVEDTLEAYIRFPTGSALFYATTAYSCDAPVMLELHCQNKTLRLEEDRVTVIMPDKTRREQVFAQPEPMGKSYWGNGHHACIADFYRCLKDGKPAPIGIAQAAETVQLMLALYDSAR